MAYNATTGNLAAAPTCKLPLVCCHLEAFRLLYSASDLIGTLLRFCTSAGSNIVVEEFLDGEEASFFALLDGHTCLALASAQVSALARLYTV